MLTRIAELVLRSPRRVAATVVLLFIVTAAFGLPVVTKLLAGGYSITDSESARAAQILADDFDTGSSSLVFTITDPNGVDTPAARTRGEEIGTALATSPYARNVLSYWTTPPQFAAALV